jgi:hypothetical protein
MMSIRNQGVSLTLFIGMAALLSAGCQPAQQAAPSSEPQDLDSPSKLTETQRMAEASLGKQAEILAQGNLAGNGSKQVLVVNRSHKTSGGDGAPEKRSAIFITRAAILEENIGNWAEVLRCDEHLKNPMGYLGGSPTARVVDWHLEYAVDSKRGLELKFTPAGDNAGNNVFGTGEPAGQTVVVRWNTKAKRYQSLNKSGNGYLSEASTLETPYSILK